jgi:hypothetical protein
MFYNVGFRFRIKNTLNDSNMVDPTLFAEYKNKMTYMVIRGDSKTFFSKVSNKATSIHYLNENTATLHFSLFFHRSSALSPAFISKIDQIISSGFVQKFEETRNSVAKQLDDEQKTQRLTMGHLGICFAVIMICLGFCCIVFIVEYIFGKHAKY